MAKKDLEFCCSSLSSILTKVRVLKAENLRQIDLNELKVREEFYRDTPVGQQIIQKGRICEGKSSSTYQIWRNV